VLEFINVDELRVYGKKKRYIKIHFAVDIEVIAMDVKANN
jgi:hypothetical protein